jgi:hypothetical protein
MGSKMIEKPSWKLEAERVGESLPEYWSLTELARYLELANSNYLTRLAKENRFPTYKIGAVRFIKNEYIHMVIKKIKKR